MVKRVSFIYAHITISLHNCAVMEEYFLARLRDSLFQETNRCSGDFKRMTPFCFLRERGNNQTGQSSYSIHYSCVGPVYIMFSYKWLILSCVRDRMLLTSQANNLQIYMSRISDLVWTVHGLSKRKFGEIRLYSTYYRFLVKSMI